MTSVDATLLVNIKPNWSPLEILTKYKKRIDWQMQMQMGEQREHSL